MSKVGRKPIEIPDGVTVKQEKNYLIVKGPKGELRVPLNESNLSLKISDKSIVVERKNDSKRAKSMHGTLRQLIYNAVTGVSKGFEKVLEVVGVGYKVNLKDKKTLELNVGYSNKTIFKTDKDIEFKVEGNKIIVYGIDKQIVGQVASNIRDIRPPDAYKGKGIRYAGEYIKLKPGKQAIKK